MLKETDLSALHRPDLDHVVNPSRVGHSEIDHSDVVCLSDVEHLRMGFQMLVSTGGNYYIRW